MAPSQHPFVSFAQNREDVVLFRALRNIKDGFYIDVGANDPTVDSVTRAFYDRGWRGINLEPSTAWFARLAAARPRDINLNAAAASCSGETSFHEVAGTGLSTCDAAIGKQHQKAGAFPVAETRVATVTLAEVCEQHVATEVHFLKIDVEGAEKDVLEGMDFGRVRPWIVVVEALDPIDLRSTHEQWEPLLDTAGYDFALFDGLNRFYYDRHRPELKDRLAAPANVLDHFVPASQFFTSLTLPKGFGINLLGQFSSATGLGVTARQTAHALARAGIPTVCFDVGSYYATGDVAEELVGIGHLITRDPAALPHPINLYCLPVTDFPGLTSRIPALSAGNRFHVGVVWWETTQLHPAWAEALSRLDVVIAYSEFLANVIANSLPLTPVITGKQPLFLPDGVRTSRTTFGLPADVTVFASSFDPSSDPARKNPVATIAAFRHAFPDYDANVRLVFRLNNADATQMGRDSTRLLVEAAEGDSRIGFIVKPLSYREVLSLYASVDAYVSLHRAEGLGLGMLESMRLGIPVVATAWSGNMTFMDHECACLVRYRLTQTSGNHPFYKPEVLGPDARWAEPVIEDAITWMRWLHANPLERRLRGEAGRKHAERYQEEALTLGWVKQLAHAWHDHSLLPKVQEKFSFTGAIR
ncbi:MAG: FkbM family methyltransferase [Gammaproteobacteria bacterium]|nr:FkbM family methyltransferase [Gammaproteobacteria bacterium]MBU1645076.1 FkbM family methyltransferase [Gammaproteobacteria bacterium]MBU1973313.1 FkbM family methyltransferase [Gammaproteobacteria bacterium]